MSNDTFLPATVSANITLSIANDTNSTTILTAQWTVMPIFSLITFVLGIFGNAVLLTAFARDRTLHTPFNIYLINLLMADFSIVAVQYPMDFIMNLYSFTWILGDRACTAYIYAEYVLQGAAGSIHQLIAYNRVWAVIHPVSYRNYHSTRVAVCLCLGMWVYVHLAVAPLWAMDALYYRQPLQPIDPNGCLLNVTAQSGWSLFVQLVIYDWPVVAMILATVVVLLTLRARKRQWVPGINVIVPTFSGTHNLGELAAHGVVTASRGRDTSRTSVQDRVSTVGNRSSRKGTRAAQRSHGNLVLMLLTASFVICWTPIDIFFTMSVYQTIDIPILYQILTIIVSFQPVLDPFLFALALKGLRDGLRSFFSCCTREHL